MGLTDEGLHLRRGPNVAVSVRDAVIGCLPTAKWAIAELGEPGAEGFDVYGPSPAGWWHVVPTSRTFVGFCSDRTVMRRLAKALRSTVLGTMVFDGTVATLAASTSINDYEVLATSQPPGLPRLGRARAKSDVWRTLLPADADIRALGKAMRGPGGPEDQLVATLQLLGLDDPDALFEQRENSQPIASFAVRSIPKKVVDYSPAGFEFSIRTPEIVGDEHAEVSGSLLIEVRGIETTDVTIEISGPAVRSGSITHATATVQHRSPVTMRPFDHRLRADLPEVTASTSITIATSGTTADAGASSAVLAARADGVDHRKAWRFPISIRQAHPDGSRRSVRNVWASVRFRPGDRDDAAWQMLTDWMSTPGLDTHPEAPCQVLLDRRDKMPAVRDFKIREIGNSSRWNRLRSDLVELDGVSGSPSAHAFIPDEGWTGFSYARVGRYSRDFDATAFTPRLTVYADRAFAAPDAPERAVRRVADTLDQLVTSNKIIQAVSGASGKDDNDYYKDRWDEARTARDDVAWSTTWLWSLGSTIWLGTELADRLDDAVIPTTIATRTPLGTGCRIDLANDADVDQLDHCLEGLRHH